MDVEISIQSYTTIEMLGTLPEEEIAKPIFNAFDFPDEALNIGVNIYDLYLLYYLNFIIFHFSLY